MKHRIQKATIEDLPEVQRLRKKLFEYEKDQFDNRLNTKWSYEEKGIEKLTERIKSPDDIVLLVEKESKNIGILIGSTWADPTIKDHKLVAELSSLYIDEGFRGEGIGSELIEKCIAWAKEKGAERLTLNVAAVNDAALSLYKKYGFNDYYMKLKKDL
ncbi:MAG: GNAT family N-acetyltransferase [Patescibacteria group bacterium]|jgi:ribosomal protein S18 acetylase RimI-like enzyme